MLQSGETLAGYRIEAVAGVGGMGIVYRATQTSLDRPVALKVLSSTLVGNRTFRERFRREGRHAAALDHPNIIPVYEAGESNGLMFIAMRLVDGPSLADIIERRELSGNAAIGILRSVASALDAAHDAGLVHRDIKPQNILLTTGGHPYLADFGITKGSDHAGLTHSGDFVGSLNYVAPEQIEGKEVGGSSDVYSLAAVLFQALTGAYPYQRDTDAALMHAHLSADPPTLSDRGIVAPAALDALFTRGMAKSPDQRFASGTELLEACIAAVSTVTPDQLERTPSFPVPESASHDPEPDDAPATSTQPDRFVWTPPAVPPPTPVATPVPPRPAPDEARAQASAGNLTTADSRRPGGEAEPAPERAPRDGATRAKVTAALPWVGMGLLLLLAPIAGYALGNSPDPPAPQTASAGAVALTHDAAWKPGSGSVEGLTLDDPITLRRTDGVKLVAGRVPKYAPGYDPLPKAVQQRLTEPAKPVVAKLGERQVIRYAGTLKSGDRLWVALAPDSKGWTAVACEGADADRAGGCATVASTERVSGATPVTPGPDAAVAKGVSAALTKLGAARKDAAIGLAAKKSVAKREAAARKLANAHDTTASQLRKLKARPQEAALLAALARAVDDEGAAIARVGAAAGDRDAAKYRRARGAVRRHEAAVDAALERLQRAGYGEA